MPPARRRVTDRVRVFADEISGGYDRQVTIELHDLARRAEKRRQSWTPSERLERIGHR